MVRSSGTWSRLRWLGVNLCRLLLSVTFVLSGIVKLIDPLGTQYKIEDYAQAFGLAALLPGFLPLLLAIVLALVEFDLGICLFFGFNRRGASRFALLFMAVMTPLTLYLALENPVSDCGCFGDAWPLTNWQTFYKNLVLLAASIVVVCYGRLMTRLVMEDNQWIITLYSKVFGFVFVCINLYGLPVWDFRPYHIGADLLEKMSARVGTAEVETYFLMEKDGERKEFTLADYPDSTWTFVSSRTAGLQDGGDILPEITDFRMMRIPDNEDITEAFLGAEGYKFLLVAPYLESADDGTMDRIAEVYDYSLRHGYPFYCLTASGDSAIYRWTEMTGADYAYCHTDDIVLKTMIRSNPGLMLLKGSTVVNKWPNTSFPTTEELNVPAEESESLTAPIEGRARRLLRIFLWYVLPLLGITVADRSWLGMKLRKLHKQHQSLTFNNEQK